MKLTKLSPAPGHMEAPSSALQRFALGRTASQLIPGVGPTRGRRGGAIVEHVTFPVLDEGCTRVVTQEVLEIEREGPGTVRLLHSPALVSGVARGDIVELDGTELSGFRIIKRSGILAAVVAGFASAGQRRDAERVLGIEVQALSGVCEGGPARALVFSIPVGAGFTAVEAFLNGVKQRFPGVDWYFGNVYGPNGQPLDWWT